ncbi:hypothetical protein [Runella zeae]|uniref:nSTAND3 domain-containing NTPase n=1 Tax=Runella zeae TaxID=94255 RepID=UPI00235718BB|nr:hypothetical protein [Runella zeae]
MNQPDRQLLYSLNKVTVRISLSGEIVGSGFILHSLDKSCLYILTARHCLAEDEESLPGLSSISLEWYDEHSGNFHPFSFQVENGEYLDLGGDLLGIALSLPVSEISSFDLPLIQIGVDLLDLQSPCIIKGFPNVSAHEAVKVNCHYAEQHGAEFDLDTDKRFESGNSKFAQENTGGFSGSGVVFIFDNELFFTGIVLRYQASLQQFKCINLQRFIDFLAESEFPPLAIKMREHFETDAEIVRDISRLRQISVNDEKKITDQIGTVRLDRKAVNDLQQQLVGQQLLIVWGQPGRGKSVAVKQLLNQERKKGAEVLFLDAVRLRYNNLVESLNVMRLNSDESQLLNSPAWRKPLIILIDGTEKLFDANAITPLTELIQHVKSNKFIKIILTCRHYILNQLQLDLHYQIPKNYAIVEIKLLNEEELQQVTSHYPIITQLLQNPRLAELIHTPFYLDLVVRFITGQSVTKELSVAEFKQLLWEQIIEKRNMARGQQFIALTLKKAREITPYVQVSEPLDAAIIEAFCRENVLIQDAHHSDWVTPTHDIFEDWALGHFVQSAFLLYQQPDLFFSHLGTAPAIRRAYRRWLSEIFDGSDTALQADANAFVQKIVSLESLDRIWQDETIVALLKSANNRLFWESLPTQWFSENNFQRLWKIIGLLRTACQEPDEALIKSFPPKDLETPFQDIYLTPVGMGWEIVVNCIYQHRQVLNSYHTYLLDFLLFVWAKKLSLDKPLPVEAQQVGELLVDWLNEFENGRIELSKTEYQESIKLLFRLVSVVPEHVSILIIRASHCMLQSESPEQVQNGAIPRWHLHTYYKDILEYALGFKYSFELCRAMPDIILKIAFEYWLLPPSSRGATSRDNAYLFGINDEIDDYYYPASAYQTCIWHLLKTEPIKAMELVTKLVNHSVNMFVTYHPDILVNITLNIKGSIINQKGTWQFWEMYREGAQSTSLIASVLMALERWLLDLVQVESVIIDNFLDFAFDYLLVNSQCISTTAVLASVAMAYPDRIGARVLPILTAKEFYFWDSGRMSSEYTKGSYSVFENRKNHFAKPERDESNKLPHRRQRLEDLTVFLQRIGYKDEVHAILDQLWQTEPLETAWRLMLKRMDLRHWATTEIIEREGHKYAVVAPKLEEDLETIVREVSEESDLNTKSLGAFLWAKGVLDYDSSYENSYGEWNKHFEAHQDGNSPLEGTFLSLLDNFTSAQEGLAAVGVRDYWGDMSDGQRRWCINELLKKAERSLQEDNFFSMVQGETLFVMPILLDKPEVTEAEIEKIKRILFKVLIFQRENNLVVPLLLRGVVRNLWVTAPLFAQNCVLGLCRLACHKETLTTISYSKSSNRPADKYYEFLTGQVINDKVTFKINRLSTIKDETFWYLGRALAIIDWEFSSTFNIELAKQSIELYTQYLIDISKPKQYNYWGYKKEVGIRERMEIEDQIGRFLYHLPGPITLPLFQSILEIDTNPHRDAKDSMSGVISKLISLEDHQKKGHLWDLWLKLAEAIPNNASYLLPFLFLRFQAQNDGWKETAEEWIPLQGKLALYQGWFREFGKQSLISVVRLMSDIGLKELVPNCLPWLSEVLASQPFDQRLKNALERLVQRTYYRYKPALRVSRVYQQSFIAILNWLIEYDSPVAYELRDRMI